MSKLLSIMLLSLPLLVSCGNSVSTSAQAPEINEQGEVSNGNRPPQFRKPSSDNNKTRATPGTGSCTIGVNCYE